MSGGGEWFTLKGWVLDCKNEFLSVSEPQRNRMVCWRRLFCIQGTFTFSESKENAVRISYNHGVENGVCLQSLRSMRIFDIT